jgi:hypothetical protein
VSSEPLAAGYRIHFVASAGHADYVDRQLWQALAWRNTGPAMR